MDNILNGDSNATLGSFLGYREEVQCITSLQKYLYSDTEEIQDNKNSIIR
jgi:hypothetical protein